MEFNGRVQGAAARKYAGFSYRVPVFADVTMRQLDPERLTYADEYPRSVNPPSSPSLQTVELANYVVKFGSTGSDGMCSVQVWLMPNKFTLAKAALMVCELQVANGFVLRHEYCDDALRRAFGVAA